MIRSGNIDSGLVPDGLQEHSVVSSLVSEILVLPVFGRENPGFEAFGKLCMGLSDAEKQGHGQ